MVIFVSESLRILIATYIAPACLTIHVQLKLLKTVLYAVALPQADQNGPYCGRFTDSIGWIVPDTCIALPSL